MLLSWMVEYHEAKFDLKFPCTQDSNTCFLGFEDLGKEWQQITSCPPCASAHMHLSDLVTLLQQHHGFAVRCANSDPFMFRGQMDRLWKAVHVTHLQPSIRNLEASMWSNLRLLYIGQCECACPISFLQRDLLSIIARQVIASLLELERNP